ncbi:DUF29 domain-containing protein [Crocosphaera sp. XPORK-15E]|uniref:DUF29 domain-containing protein n=1 Tax=Crocosphaera sp. XPORK-15E TaxID=3110247 RepID=UPI002B204263|nr:DUF29 domain-containing protein [Crocosphaera sp. XPORK-15E]MEA5533904.1 DUF29 domain-containing protein [Crocosphaera sp. XPORK-15E]
MNIKSVTSSLQLLYEKDYQIWLEETVKLLSDRSFDRLDLDNLIEEIKDMGKSQKEAVESNLTILLMHLLKYQYQPEKRQDSNSWRSSIVEHRRRLLRTFKRNPSLKRYFDEVFDECYQDARQDAKTETQLPLNIFPKTCPFTKEDILNPDFLP